jgi:hypothetical protein
MRKILLYSLAVVIFSVPSYSLIVHHCDYTPSQVTSDVHSDHSNGCDNTDSNGEAYHGSCDYSSGFYWTAMTCTASTCSLSGQIRCPGPGGTYYLRTYDFTCHADDGTGDAEPASASRTEAKCTEQTMDSNGSYFPTTTHCDCSASESFWNTYCN